MMNEATLGSSLALVASIDVAIASGVEHLNAAGEKLVDAAAVLRTIRDEGQVTILCEGGPTSTTYGVADLRKDVGATPDT